MTESCSAAFVTKSLVLAVEGRNGPSTGVWGLLSVCVWVPAAGRALRSRVPQPEPHAGAAAGSVGAGGSSRRLP